MIDFNRRTMLASTVMLAVSFAAANAAHKPPTILFICQAGTAKSAIARELFRKRARERGIAVVAFSRGLHIEDHVSLTLRQKLATEAIAYRRDGFVKLSPRDIRSADVIVTFTPIPKDLPRRELHDWSSVPSVNDSYAAARADIDARIDALLDSIAAAGTKR